MSECKCKLSISVLGDGCRYCQPQEYINKLHLDYDEIDKENDELLEKNEGLEREIAEEKEFNQIVIDANEQYIIKIKKANNEILKLKILVQQERYENQENKLASVRGSSSHERVMEEEEKLKNIAIEINKLKEQGDE